MLVGLAVAIVLIAGLVVLLVRRPRRAAPPRPAPTTSATVAATSGALAAHDAPLRLRSMTRSLSDALWRHAFGATATAGELPAAHRAVRDAVLATLGAPVLAGRHFPRRPMLMPQLLHALNDPDAGPATLAAIVAQDPVLTGDVLRLANSAFYRIAPDPVETIQRAIVVCGSDGLQSLVATALMQPVFRSAQAVFARFPSLLWERTSLAALAAELYCLETKKGDRLLAQLSVLLGALGPLVIYRAAIEAYAKAPGLEPHAALFLELIDTSGAATSRQIAEQWDLPARVVSALEVEVGTAPTPDALPLAEAIEWGGFLGTLATLEREHAIGAEEAARLELEAGLPPQLAAAIYPRLRGEA